MTCSGARVVGRVERGRHKRRWHKHDQAGIGLGSGEVGGGGREQGWRVRSGGGARSRAGLAAAGRARDGTNTAPHHSAKRNAPLHDSQCTARKTSEPAAAPPLPHRHTRAPRSPAPSVHDGGITCAHLPRLRLPHVNLFQVQSIGIGVAANLQAGERSRAGRGRGICREGIRSHSLWAGSAPPASAGASCHWGQPAACTPPPRHNHATAPPQTAAPRVAPQRPPTLTICPTRMSSRSMVHSSSPPFLPPASADVAGVAGAPPLSFCSRARVGALYVLRDENAQQEGMRSTRPGWSSVLGGQRGRSTLGGGGRAQHAIHRPRW